MENELVGSEQQNGPFGAKGLGESGTFGVSPAIANAIHDAIGVRLTELPLKPEAVLPAIRAAQGRPIAEGGLCDARACRGHPRLLDRASAQAGSAAHNAAI